MNKLVLKPAVEKIEGGWVGKSALYEGNLAVACEVFNAYDNKQECWDNLLTDSQKFADKHNKTCRCGKLMVVGSY